MAKIRSKERVADHGEVFTPEWLVDEMLDLVEDEVTRIDSRVLEPACGSGNFLVPILQRKLSTAKAKYEDSNGERANRSLYALMSIYGIELLEDNIVECRDNLADVFVNELCLKDSDDILLAALHVLRINLVHGNALEMLTHHGNPIVFPEWSYDGDGVFTRRDFLFEDLAKTRELLDGESLFSQPRHGEKNDDSDALFKPKKIYPPMDVRELARAEVGTKRKAA